MCVFRSVTVLNISFDHAAINKILEFTETESVLLADWTPFFQLVGLVDVTIYVYQHIKLLVSKQFSCLRLIGIVQFQQPATNYLQSNSSSQLQIIGWQMVQLPTAMRYINDEEIAEASEVAVEDILPLVDNARTVVIPIYHSYRPALKYIIMGGCDSHVNNSQCQ